jgi:molybdopterin/thiamine biosynthesis adenylyltransferase
MMQLVISTNDLAVLRDGLLASEVEHCAVLYAEEVTRSDGVVRLLVRDIDEPSAGDYAIQAIDRSELTPEFVARVAKRAKLNKLSLIFAHSHPGLHRPQFSSTDDAGEKILATFLTKRGLNSIHAALVVSRGGMRARRLGTREEVDVISVGSEVIVESTAQNCELEVAKQFDRQVRAFGADGQRVLHRLRVGIVGLGGTGSILAQQLVHLGVRDFILIDPDTIAETNLNRVVGATFDDIGVSKIDVVERYLIAHSATTKVRKIPGNVVRTSVAQELSAVDVIFSCTDSHGSRSVIQQIAYQYLIPCIDMGSTITTDDGKVTGIFGRVQLLSPGEPCLWCCNLLDTEQVRRDMMSDVERRLDPYIQGFEEPAPSVVWLNGTVVSLAVGMLMAVVTSAPLRGRHLIYNAQTASLRSVRATPRPDCFICSKEGVMAKGDGQQLYARQD